MDRPSVFLSHTAELTRYPSDHSFIRAAEDGITRAGCVSIEMQYFPADDQRAAEYCMRRVRSSDVYIGVLGFRYGSTLSSGPDISYTELEFDEATAAGLPRLVFLLDDSAQVPIWFSDANRSRQEEFRRKVRASGLVTVSFRTPAELELAVYQAVSELNSATRADEDSSPYRTKWMVPPEWNTTVPRPELSDRLANMLTAPGGQRIGITTALQGAGGFGKTTLAAQACRSAEIRGRFPGGILWITIGEQTAGAALAAKINDLNEVVSGHRPTVSDPDQAGYLLGESLGGGMPRLLVVDDVWTRTQLRPFLQGGDTCSRLITTRIHGVLPQDSASIEVDAMEHAEARRVLSTGLEEVPGGIANELVRLTGRWPVLLTLVNSTMRRMVTNGATVAEAAANAARRLRAAGPTALDVSHAHQRQEAVAATIGVSLEFLAPDRLDRYFELAIFPEDVLIPQSMLNLLWQQTGGLDAVAIERMCEELADLSLVQTFHVQPAALGLHDVVRGYMRQHIGPERLSAMNAAFIAAADRLVSDSNRASHEAPWWLLPHEQDYLWRHLSYHLVEADQHGDLARTVRDLRWVSQKLELFGPVEVEADLAFADTVEANELRRVLSQNAHLLAPMEPREGMTVTLLARLDGVGKLAGEVSTFRDVYRKPLLYPLIPLPDRPHPALRRILAGQGVVRLLGCTATPDGKAVIGGGEDRLLRVWNLDTGATVATLEGHSGPVWACATSPDGSWVASGGDDSTVRIWDVATGTCRRVLTQGAPVRACIVGPDGSWLACGGDDRVVRIWGTDQGKLDRELVGHQGAIRAIAASPDGSWLATGGDDMTVRIWDVATGAHIHTLTGHSASIWAAIAGPDGRWLATGGLDRTVRVWDVQTGELRNRFETPSGPVLTQGDWPGGRWLASGGDEGLVEVRDLESGRVRGVLEGHSGRIRTCAADPSGRWLVTGGDDHSVRLWDMWAVGLEDADHLRTTPMWTCVTVGGSHQVVTGELDGAIRLWDLACGQSELVHRVTAPVWTSALSPDGTRLAVGGQGGHLWLIDLATGVVTAQWVAHTSAVWACAFLDGSRLVTAGDEPSLRIWEPEGKASVELTGHSMSVRCCAATEDGTVLVSGGEDGTLRLWDVESGTTRQVLNGHMGAVRACATSPDREWIFSGGDDGTLRLWHARSGTLRHTVAAHHGRVRGCVVNATGELVASVGADQTLKIWGVGAEFRCLTAIRLDSTLADCHWLLDADTLCAVGNVGLYVFNFIP